MSSTSLGEQLMIQEMDQSQQQHMQQQKQQQMQMQQQSVEQQQASASSHTSSTMTKVGQVMLLFLIAGFLENEIRLSEVQFLQVDEARAE
jgi:hypothetical protein